MGAGVLVLINGLPGSGKSTLAREYADRHPSAVALDIDVLRTMIGGWRADREAAGLQARAMALAVAADQLAAGRTVLVPQLLARPGFIDQLAALADSRGARWVETVIDAPPALCRKRYGERTARAVAQADADGPVWLATDDDAGWAEIALRLTELLAQRPGTLRLPAAGPLDRLERALAEGAAGS